MWRLWMDQLGRGHLTLLGRVAPHPELQRMSLTAGALEAADGAVIRGRAAVPMSGLPAARLKSGATAPAGCLDLTLPSIRRIRALIRTMRLEQRRVIVVSGTDDDMSATLAAEGAGIVSCADDVMRLDFAPRSAVLAHPCTATRRIETVASVLRRRFPDASLTVLDTRDPEFLAREKAVVLAARQLSRLVVLGDGGLDASVNALFEAARWSGIDARIAPTAAEAVAHWMPGTGLACGIFTPLEDAVAAGIVPPTTAGAGNDPSRHAVRLPPRSGDRSR